MKYIIILLGIVILDFFILDYIDQFELKSFVVLHASLLFLGGVIASSLYFLKDKKEYLGLVVMGGFLIKMGVMFSIFILLYNKVGLTQGQIFNFLVVYALYTIVYTLVFIKNLNPK